MDIFVLEIKKDIFYSIFHFWNGFNLSFFIIETRFSFFIFHFWTRFSFFIFHFWNVNCAKVVQTYSFHNPNSHSHSQMSSIFNNEKMENAIFDKNQKWKIENTLNNSIIQKLKTFQKSKNQKINDWKKPLSGY